MKSFRLVIGVIYLALVASYVVGSVGSAQTPAQPAKLSCTVQSMTPGPADVALNDRKFADAAGLYQAVLDKTPDSVPAKVGLVRSMAGQGKLAEALDLANKYAAAAPNDAALAEAVGEVRFRRGEIEEAAVAYNKAQHLDPCLPAVHAAIARYQTLAGNFLTAQKQIDFAHHYSPDDPAITRQWEHTHGKPMSTDEMVRKLTDDLNLPGATAEQKKTAENRIKQVKAMTHGGCEVVEPLASAKMTMFPIQYPGGEVSDNESSGVAIDVELNGKRLRLQVDTGASGLVITKAAAGKAGLTAEADLAIGGFGDQGATRGSVSHVDKVRVAGMEFRDCEVEIADGLHGELTDGLIGPDVFARWIVTLNTPERELTLSPLPKRPGDAESNEALRLDMHGATGNGQESTDGPHDRYIAPEMQGWTKVYRSGHFLIMPVKVNDQPYKLFIMDSGDWTDQLDMAFAKTLGRLTLSDRETRGLSGYAKHNYLLETPTTLTFAGVKQPVSGILVTDLAAPSRGVGVEMPGFLGYKTLKEFVVSIDYRDNLVKFTFDASKGFHQK